MIVLTLNESNGHGEPTSSTDYGFTHAKDVLAKSEHPPQLGYCGQAGCGDVTISQGNYRFITHY